MSTEQKFYKQLEGIVTSVIKALEGLEKELSEYVKVTNNRLQKLEDKINKIESLVDVSGKGLVKAIESAPAFENVETLAHIATQAKAKTSEKISPPLIQKKEIFVDESAKPESNFDAESTTASASSVKVPQIQIPPITKSLKKEEHSIEIPDEDLKQKEELKPSILDKSKKDILKKEDDEDKDELRSALKIIDSL